MALITIRDLSIRFRGPALLEGIECRIDAGQKIGLLGRNGAGKTTFMRLLMGQVEPDRGAIEFAPGARMAFLPQEVPDSLPGTVRDVIDAGLAAEADEELVPSWERARRVEAMLERMGLTADAPVAALSSGMKRRVLLARALVTDPDLLLLDEPTNHLDLEAIRWLESFLQRWRGTLLFVTHDRVFLQTLATRILEIDGGRLFDWSCDYATFLERKEAALAAAEKQQALFDKKLAQEEAWIRQGIRARRTRNEGRVKALKALREQHQQRRAKVGQMKLQIEQGQKSGTLVASLERVGFAYDARTIFRDFSTQIMRGDRLGIVGPNGAGKTTLLKTILGQLQPQTGQVRLGTNLAIAYFDQLRDQLDGDKTVQENVADGYDSIRLGGRTQHVLGYLQDFLFTPERARSPVRFLSGGERNRLLLAKLFARPANVVVLDEPTNDLDTESLELLEEKLVEFTGTVLVVSHDRAFLNNVVTSLIAFESDGVREYEGGYDDWLKQSAEARGSTNPAATGKAGSPPDDARRADPRRAEPLRAEPPQGKPLRADEAAPSGGQTPASAQRSRKLSYREQRELEGLPQRIEALEAEIEALHQQMADPAFYQRDREQIVQAQEQLATLEGELAAAYARWELLDAGG